MLQKWVMILVLLVYELCKIKIHQVTINNIAARCTCGMPSLF